MTGLFLAFEGGEGAGKSTQARLLAEAVRRDGRDVVLTYEPGATGLGQRLRDILLGDAVPVGERAEALLYAADRAQHVREVIEPGLERGAVVITDRYVGSSLAYQGAGRALDLLDVEQLSNFATDFLLPDHTVLLDLDPATGLRRAGRVGEPDRLEAEAIEFHQRVRDGFRRLAAEQDGWIVVDAAADAQILHRQILDWFRAVTA